LTYEYNPPIISNVSPATGTSKSLTFTIYGDYFRESADVYVGESIGNVINLTRKNILCNIRDYEEKIIDIEVVNIDNKSAHKIFARKFLPMIQNITPQVVYLPMLDSVSITITGEHFETGLAVTMAGNIITDLTNTDTTITFNAPLFNGYTKTDITVINPDKTLSTKKDVFEYRDVKANFVISPGTTGKAPYRVLFEDKSDGKISNIKKWIWQYADGKSKISNSKFFAYQYNNIGVYPVTMSVVVLSNGQTYTDTAAVKTINVEHPDIVLGFDTIGGHVGYPPFTILLDNQTTYADNLDITWTWDFGNGNTSHEESPEHTYTQTGSYTVTLRAEINDEIKTIQKPNYISVIESKPGRMTGKISFDNEDKLPDNTWVHFLSPETGEESSVPVDENGYYTAIDLDPDKEYIIFVDFKFVQAYYSDTTVFSYSQAVAVTPADGYNITLPSQFYSVNGKVIFENGQPVSDIMIEAFSKTNGYWTFSISHTRIIEDANYTLNELIPGTYEVNIFSDKYSLKGDSLPITITVNADNPVVKIPDVILMEPTGSISGTISGLASGTNALISAFSPSIDFAQSINIIGTDEDIQYTINNLKPADDYVLKLNASGFPDIYYNSKDKWSEANEVNLINQYHQSNINFTLLFYEGEILGEIIVPCGANMGDIVWIDAYSESMGSHSSTMIQVASDCEDQLGCSYSYMIRGLKRSDDYIVLANSDIYLTVVYDNQPNLNEEVTLVDISSENPKHIDFNIDFNIPITFFLIEGVVLDSQGEGLSNIDIRIFCESTGNFRTNTTDALGNFKILNLNSESGYLIQAIKPNEAPYYYKEGVNHTRDINMATKVYPASLNPGIMARIIIPKEPPPVISISSNKQTLSTPKVWTWHTDKPNCLFRYSIDKNETWEASGVFTAITSATLDKKYGLYYIHIQAKDEDGNQSDIVSDRNIDIDFTLPTIQKLKDDPTPKQSIRWNWSSDKNCLFSFCVDQTGTCEPAAEDFSKITTKELKHGDGKWYLHVKAVDLNGNISSKKVWALLDNTPPDITIFQKENDQKTWHWSSGNETNCTFRHTINQNDSWTASGTFNAITSIKFDGYTLCYLHIQAKDQAGNLSDVKSIKISDPLPDEIKVTSKGTGVMLQWPDKTFTNKVKSYQIYRSFDSNGPFVKIDPIIIKREDINDLIYYGIFDPFTNLDIQQNASYWYAISAQIPDDTFSRLSTPVKGEIQTTDDSLQLISLQQELEGIPGQTVTFNIYVIAGGNFNDSVDLSAAYPSEKPNLVAYEFSETTVIPPALVNLDVNFSFDADPGAYDIEISANGGDRSDSIMLRFSIISQDPQDSFISTHIKQKNVRLGENMDKLGHVSLRMNDKIDIYGSIIPVEENQKINVIIQNEHQQLTETINTNSEGYYELTFQPKDIGNYTVYSQYINSQIQSDVTQFSVRKSNQSKILCETGNQIIDLKEIIKIHLQLNPKLDNIPIHYQITKPDQTKQTNDLKTDVNGECDLNIYLSQAGIWEILTWWEGNDHYEGQLSKPLYLYPGVETPRALIIAGHQENDLLWPAFRYLADRFYQLLINRRLNDDLIYLMSSGYDADDSRIDNNSPTEQAIANYLKSLYPDNSPSKVNDKIPLIIYMVDHGGQKKFLLNTDKYLKADFLDQQLDNLQDETQCEVQVIIDACYSGSFKDALAPSESQKRIIITSTGPKNPSYIDHDGRESFSSHLFNWLFQGYSLGESFSFAKYGIGETPKIYEGQVPDINNIQLANETHLGGTFATSNLMPNIIFHTPNQVLSNPSLTITAEVIDIEDSKCLVWASILPPNHHKPIFGEFNSPQWQLERIDLSPVPGEENIYAGKYDCFYQKGLYVVYLYASDSVGNIDSKEVYLNVTQDHIPQNWGDMDGNRMIDLEDAIIGLQILSGVPHEVSLDCKHRLSLEEILYSLNIMAELN
jgi:PKD repeat protein